jgi:polyisoprenoid-binding protein YceI
VKLPALLLVGLHLLHGAAPVAAPAAEPAAPVAVKFRLDPAKSRLEALLFEDPRTNNSGRSHDHVVVATGWDGHLSWDPDGVCTGEVTLPVAGLVPDAEADRARHGLTDPLSAVDRELVVLHMMARDQLDAARFPSITYTVDGCVAKDPGRWVIVGKLKLHGVSAPVPVALTGTFGPEGLSLKGQANISQARFGITPYMALFGQRRNQDAVQILIDIQGAPAP